MKVFSNLWEFFIHYFFSPCFFSIERQIIECFACQSHYLKVKCVHTVDEFFNISNDIISLIIVSQYEDSRQFTLVLGTEFRFSFSSTKLAPASDIYPWLGMRQDLPKQHGQHILQMWSKKVQIVMLKSGLGEIMLL